MSEQEFQLKRDNNPRRMEAGLFQAHLGYYPKFGNFSAVYQHAVESLYRRVSEGNDTADNVAFPLLFLMRHTLELGYKYSLFHLCALNATVFSPEAKGQEGHSLTKLHERLGKEFRHAVKNGARRGSEGGFDEYYQLTAASMRRLDKLDPSSTRSRYPNSDESAAWSPEKTINLFELKNEFDDAMILLNTLVDVIGDHDIGNNGYYYLNHEF